MSSAVLQAAGGLHHVATTRTIRRSPRRGGPREPPSLAGIGPHQSARRPWWSRATTRGAWSAGHSSVSALGGRDDGLEERLSCAELEHPPAGCADGGHQVGVRVEGALDLGRTSSRSSSPGPAARGRARCRRSAGCAHLASLVKGDRVPPPRWRGPPRPRCPRGYPSRCSPAHGTTDASTGTKSTFSRTPQSGQHQSSGTSAHAVPAANPSRSSPVTRLCNRSRGSGGEHLGRASGSCSAQPRKAGRPGRRPRPCALRGGPRHVAVEVRDPGSITRRQTAGRSRARSSASRSADRGLLVVAQRW